jgi:hypothetical protein
MQEIEQMIIYDWFETGLEGKPKKLSKEEAT